MILFRKAKAEDMDAELDLKNHEALNVDTREQA